MTDLIHVGEAAPDFELAASDDQRYRLSDVLRQSRVFLVFYPGNNTPG
jgi:peroxiredoxin